MGRKSLSLMAWAVIAGTLVACSGGPPGALATPPGALATPPAAIGGPTSAIDACALLSDAEIEAATGQRAAQRTASTLTQVFPSVCDIELDGGASLIVGVKATGGREMYECCFEPFIGEGSTPPLDEAVSGLGDKAGRSGDDVLMVLAGDVLYEVQYIEFGRQDRSVVVRYLAERVLARLPCVATGCPEMSPPPAPTPGPATTNAPPPAIDPGGLPSTGAQARVVNLYSENGEPVAVDVYAYAWSEPEMNEVGALVATVEYGQASEWFNPGLIESPFSTEGSTRIQVFRAGDRTQPLAGIGEFLGPGTVTTVAIWQEEIFEGQPSALAQTLYAEHPSYPIPVAPPGQGLLVSHNAGLRADEEYPALFASVGDGCLESPLGRSDPDIPNAQPLGNDLALPVGQHTLTVHEAPVGALPTCESEPLGPGEPITVAAGDRQLAFPYRPPGATDIHLLVIPLDTR